MGQGDQASSKPLRRGPGPVTDRDGNPIQTRDGLTIFSRITPSPLRPKDPPALVEGETSAVPITPAPAAGNAGR